MDAYHDVGTLTDFGPYHSWMIPHFVLSQF